MILFRSGEKDFFQPILFSGAGLVILHGVVDGLKGIWFVQVDKGWIIVHQLLNFAV